MASLPTWKNRFATPKFDAFESPCFISNFLICDNAAAFVIVAPTADSEFDVVGANCLLNPWSGLGFFLGIGWVISGTPLFILARIRVTYEEELGNEQRIEEPVGKFDNSFNTSHWLSWQCWVCRSQGVACSLVSLRVWERWAGSAASFLFSLVCVESLNKLVKEDVINFFSFIAGLAILLGIRVAIDGW